MHQSKRQSSKDTINFLSVSTEEYSALGKRKAIVATRISAIFRGREVSNI